MNKKMKEIIQNCCNRIPPARIVENFELFDLCRLSDSRLVRVYGHAFSAGAKDVVTAVKSEIYSRMTVHRFDPTATIWEVLKDTDAFELPIEIELFRNYDFQRCMDSRPEESQSIDRYRYRDVDHKTS